MIASSRELAVTYAETFRCAECASVTIPDPEPHAYAWSPEGEPYTAWIVMVVHEDGCPLDPETIRRGEAEWEGEDE